ncbi:MAG TPA: Fic family protein [Steroidobacteraceae bacterium]|jgi:Fic family protein
MNADDFANSPTGKIVQTPQGVGAFLPNSLPPQTPLDIGSLAKPLEQATLALGQLSGIGQTLPNPHLLIRPFKRVEAVASSKIEGTVTTLSELLMLEVEKNAQNARSDTREVRNYTFALDHGLKRLKDLPVSKRLIQEMHKILLTNVNPDRGANFVPGEFKKDQNWIGARLIQNARYVPPSPADAMACMDDLEKYIHSNASVPLLVQLALIHYQFEAIHPFPDGNGRVGRLLIPLILCEKKALTQPLLYLSTFFEKHYDKYIDLMLNVSKKGEWEKWIEFFLQGVASSANNAIKKSTRLQELHKEFMGKVRSARASALLAKLVDELFDVPATTVPHAMRDLNISYNSAKNNLKKLKDLGIIKEGPDLRPQWYFSEQIMQVGFADDDSSG